MITYAQIAMVLNDDPHDVEDLSLQDFDEYEGLMDAWHGDPAQMGRSDAYNAGYALEYERQQSQDGLT